MQAFACDLDGTLIDRRAVLGDRTLAAIARSQSAGVPVLVATGRMFRSVEPYLERAGIREPVVCYQGGAVVDPRTREFLLHEPIELDVAREAIASLQTHGLSPNVYVEDRLYVAEETEYSRAYSGFQHLPVTEVGDLLGWLEREPTKLVAVADPERLAEVRLDLEQVFGARLFITTSLPHLLELGIPARRRARGSRSSPSCSASTSHTWSRSATARTTSSSSRWRVSVSRSRTRTHVFGRSLDRTCPGPAEEGVAAVIEAVLDSRG